MSESRESRSCGSCTACCKTLPVDDPQLTKPKNTWCANCKPGKGCSIYSSRPKACADFRCEWLKGRGTDAERPDRTKVVMDYLREHPASVGKGTLQMWELADGALKKDYPKAELRLALDKGVSVVHATARGNVVVFKPM
jgi:hypothetical protein